jgi:hypothetical protein
MDFETLRAFARTLPGTTEEPHFDMWSFRVGGKIYTTVPPSGPWIHVFVDEMGMQAAVAASPGTVEELRWGKQLAGVRVRLDTAEPALVQDLLTEAWQRKAPKRVVAAFRAANREEE